MAEPACSSSASSLEVEAAFDGAVVLSRRLEVGPRGATRATKLFVAAGAAVVGAAGALFAAACAGVHFSWVGDALFGACALIGPWVLALALAKRARERAPRDFTVGDGARAACVVGAEAVRDAEFPLVRMVAGGFALDWTRGMEGELVVDGRAQPLASLAAPVAIPWGARARVAIGLTELQIASALAPPRRRLGPVADWHARLTSGTSGTLIAIGLLSLLPGLCFWWLAFAARHPVSTEPDFALGDFAAARAHIVVDATPPRPPAPPQLQPKNPSAPPTSQSAATERAPQPQPQTAAAASPKKTKPQTTAATTAKTQTAQSVAPATDSDAPKLDATRDRAADSISDAAAQNAASAKSATAQNAAAVAKSATAQNPAEPAKSETAQNATASAKSETAQNAVASAKSEMAQNAAAAAKSETEKNAAPAKSDTAQNAAAAAKSENVQSAAEAQKSADRASAAAPAAAAPTAARAQTSASALAQSSGASGIQNERAVAVRVGSGAVSPSLTELIARALAEASVANAASATGVASSSANAVATASANGAASPSPNAATSATANGATSATANGTASTNPNGAASTTADSNAGANAAAAASANAGANAGSSASAAASAAHSGGAASGAPGAAANGAPTANADPTANGDPVARGTADPLGTLTGTDIGESYGVGGLGLVGTGRGGGGTGEGTIGLGDLGTIGHGGGEGYGEGYGHGEGRLGGHRTAAVPDVIGGVQIRGGYDKSLVRRVVRAHLHEIRFCYERELQKRPELAGRVVTQFVIGGQGDVLAAQVEQSSIASEAVAGCVARALRRWQFPAPGDHGLVQVTYPFAFAPSGD